MLCALPLGINHTSQILWPLVISATRLRAQKCGVNSRTKRPKSISKPFGKGAKRVSCSPGPRVDAFWPSESSRPSFSTLFNSALARASDVLIESDELEDSDEWMKLDASSFDEVLEGKNIMDVDSEGGEENRFVREQSDKLHGLAAKIEQFVQGQGDLEGARFEE